MFSKFKQQVAKYKHEMWQLHSYLLLTLMESSIEQSSGEQKSPVQLTSNALSCKRMRNSLRQSDRASSTSSAINADHADHANPFKGKLGYYQFRICFYINVNNPKLLIYFNSTLPTQLPRLYHYDDRKLIHCSDSSQNNFLKSLHYTCTIQGTLLFLTTYMSTSNYLPS